MWILLFINFFYPEKGFIFNSFFIEKANDYITYLWTYFGGLKNRLQTDVSLSYEINL